MNEDLTMCKCGHEAWEHSNETLGYNAGCYGLVLNERIDEDELDEYDDGYYTHHLCDCPLSWREVNEQGKQNSKETQ